MASPFLLGGIAWRWLNERMATLVYTPDTLPPVFSGKQRYGVLGDPVAHSLSPVMQEAGFAALGISAEYFRVEVPAGGLSAALPRLHAAGFLGWNCTLPHKESMFSLCEETDESARESATVNTVLVTDGKLRGSSTDAGGWEDAVAEAWKLDLSSQRILLLGCGGVGRTLAFRLAKRGCRQLTVANRTPGKAAQLVEELRRLHATPAALVPWESAELVAAARACDLVVHATKLGLAEGDPLPLPENSWHAGLRIYDIVYRQDYTPLVRLARSRGLPAVDGLGMLLHQGARALSLWTGQNAPISAMRTALEKIAGRPL